MTQPEIPRALLRELERTARRPEEALRWAATLQAARDAGDLDAAYDAARKVKQAAPRSTSIREVLGLIAFDRGDWHEAAAELLALRRLTGKRRYDPVIAECYRREGRASRALEFLADLPRSSVGRATWVRAQTVKARALADNGRPRVGVSVLESLRIAEPKGPAEEEALALLDELR